MIRLIQKKSLVALAIFGILFGGIQVAQAAGTNATTDRYIISFSNDDDVEGESNEFRNQGIKIHATFKAGFKGLVGDFTQAQINDLKKNPKFLYAEKDAPVYANAITSNPTVQSSVPSWGLDRIDQRNLPLSTSYSYSTNGAGVTAYVIDTGILSTHTQFTGRVTAGQNFAKNTTNSNTISPTNTTDCNGHGTHVAGTIGGSTYGVAKGVTLVPVRVLDCTGSGTTSGVIAGVDWAVGNHVSGSAVANLSLGGGYSQALNDAIQRLIADGVTVAVAAGNSNSNACLDSPSSAPNAITVGATDTSDVRAYFSSFGPCLDIFAPGVNITSSWSTNTTATNTISGTSMASPHVAGAAALLLERYPAYTPQQIRDLLVSSSTCVVTSAGAGSPNKLLATETAGVAPICVAPPAATVPATPSTPTVSSTRTRTLTANVATANNGGSAIQSFSVKVWSATALAGPANTLAGTATCTTAQLTLTCNISLTRAGFYAVTAIANNAVGASAESAKSVIVQVR